MIGRPRLVCAGPMKTGLSSCRYALKHRDVGWNVVGYMRGDAVGECEMLVKAREFDALFDLPAAAYWREIADYYSWCRVLLTVRDTDEWLASIEDWLQHEPFISPAEVAFARKLYGSTIFDRCTFAMTKERNEHEAREWGQRNPGRFLEFNVFRGDNWDQLGPFLGIDKRGGFPHIRPGAPTETWDTQGVSPRPAATSTWRK
jgi:hypothetical protein